MKTKLLACMGIVIASVSAVLLFGSHSAFAAGEKYKWVDANTIQASGGDYSKVRAANDGVLNFKKKGTSYEVYSDGGWFGCDITFTIRVAIDNKTATLQTQGCGDDAKGFDRSITITNLSKAPPFDGEDLNYANINCSQYYEGGLNVDRCEAVKRCSSSETSGGSVRECLGAWNGCIVSEANGNTPTPANYKTCLERVGGGNISDGGEGADEDENKTSCAIDGIGWMICPALSFASQLVDAAYSYVESLLVVQPLVTTGEGAQSNIYQAWSIMRNFANVAFVIAFIIIIYSQLTSFGISNYGIKRMLPRLIVAAILVNVSFWICAIAVDVSNILGASLRGLFDSIGASLQVSGSGPGWFEMTTAVLAGTAVAGTLLYVGLSALIPALLAALLAIFVVFVALSARQALIIILIVISPLAFVAYILPNTESWFNKFRKLFLLMLAMYPVIAFMFGASALASQVIINSSGDLSIKVMGALVAIIPLFLTPLIMKASGGVLNRFGVNNPSKGLFDRARRKSEDYRKNRQVARQGRAMNNQGVLGRFNPVGMAARRQARRDAINRSREGGLASAKTRYISEQATNSDSNLARNMAGGGLVYDANPKAQAAVIASALAQQKKAFQDDVSDMEASIRIKFANDPAKALKEAIENGDKTQAVAAQNILLSQGGRGASEFRTIATSAETSNPAKFNAVADELRSNIAERHPGVKAKAADLMTWATDKQGGALARSHASDLSDAELATQHAGSMEKMVNANLIPAKQAQDILNNPLLSKDLSGKQRDQLNRAIQQGGTLPPTLPPPPPTTSPTTSPTQPPPPTSPTQPPSNPTTTAPSSTAASATPNVSPTQPTNRQTPPPPPGGVNTPNSPNGPTNLNSTNIRQITNNLRNNPGP